MKERQIETVSDLLTAAAHGLADRPVYVVTDTECLRVVALRHTSEGLYLRAAQEPRRDNGGAR